MEQHELLRTDFVFDPVHDLILSFVVGVIMVFRPVDGLRYIYFSVLFQLFFTVDIEHVTPSTSFNCFNVID